MGFSVGSLLTNIFAGFVAVTGLAEIAQVVLSVLTAIDDCNGMVNLASVADSRSANLAAVICA